MSPLSSPGQKLKAQCERRLGAWPTKFTASMVLVMNIEQFTNCLGSVINLCNNVDAMSLGGKLIHEPP